MSGIDFKQKISFQRPFSKPIEAEEEYDIVRQFESDRGRIVNSAAIRRLQQKTQVFPLERNAAVRSRLTHSMEVQQVGRHIAKEILNRFKQAGRIDELGLTRLLDPFESIVEMACLMHDQRLVRPTARSRQLRQRAGQPRSLPGGDAAPA